MHLTCIHPPQQEPVSTEEAKIFTRVDHDIEDGLIAQLIQVARSTVEKYAQRSLLLQSWRMTHVVHPPKTFLGVSSTEGREFCNIELPRAPFFKILKGPSVNKRLITYEPQIEDERMVLRCRWAEVIGQEISVEFSSGYGETPESVPAALRLAILMMVAESYQNRGLEAENGGVRRVLHLLQPYVRII